jgi:probable HAF family extracellular repeat protein
MKMTVYCCMVFMLATGTASATVLYTVTDLGTLDGGNGHSRARAINDGGQVVGWATAPDGYEHAFLYRWGLMTDLGTLGGPGSRAWDINNSGQVVGEAGMTSGYDGHAFLYSDGQMIEISAAFGSVANGINEGGQVVGFAWAGHAFLYNPGGSMTDLGTFGGPYSRALKINDGGLIVGYAYTDWGYYHACLWSGDTMIDLGTLGDDVYCEAADINTSGQIVGTSGWWGHAFLYDSGVMTDLGTLGGSYSDAFAINDSGQIVGESYITGGAQHAFLYSDGGITDLNSLIDSATGWQLMTAQDINNRGQIVGYGTIAGGEQHAFLLTPVPEPGTIALVVPAFLAFAGIAAARRRVATRRK